MILFFKNFSCVHWMVSLRMLIQIQWFFYFIDLSSSLLSKNSKSLIFIHTLHCPIWPNFKKSLKITLIFHEFDPYSPLYPSFCDYLIKLVSLVIVLTLDYVFSRTSRSRFVNHLECMTKHTYKVHLKEFLKLFKCLAFRGIYMISRWLDLLFKALQKKQEISKFLQGMYAYLELWSDKVNPWGRHMWTQVQTFTKLTNLEK